MSRAKSTSATAGFGRSAAHNGWAKTGKIAKSVRSVGFSPRFFDENTPAWAKAHATQTEAYLARPRSAEVDDGEHPVHTFATRSKSGSAMTGCDCISMRVDPHPASILVTSLPR